MHSIVRYRPLFCRIAPFAAFALLAGLLPSGNLTGRADEGNSSAADEINVEASRVYIYVGKVGLGHEHAVAGRMKSGSIHLGARSKAGQIVIDMPTFAADTTEAREYLGLEGTTSASRQKEVTANMLGTDVLDVRKFPTATFQIVSALLLKQQSEDGNPLYRLTGDFTLHGVKRPLKVDAEVIEQEDGVRIHGSFEIRQTDFGIKPYSKALGAVGVTDELSIHGEIFLAEPRVAARRVRERK